MANNSVLKAAIADVVKQNGTNAITGNLLQQSLLSMIDALGGNYQYAGIATPTTNPGTPDQNVFYLASTAGTYTNFGGIVLADGEFAILKYNGSWTKDVTGAATDEAVNQLYPNFDAKPFSAIKVLDNTIAKNKILGREALIQDALFVMESGVDNYLQVTRVRHLYNGTQNVIQINVCSASGVAGVNVLNFSQGNGTKISNNLEYFEGAEPGYVESAKILINWGGLRFFDEGIIDLCDSGQMFNSIVFGEHYGWIQMHNAIPGLRAGIIGIQEEIKDNSVRLDHTYLNPNNGAFGTDQDNWTTSYLKVKGGARCYFIDDGKITPARWGIFASMGSQYPTDFITGDTTPIKTLEIPSTLDYYWVAISVNRTTTGLSISTEKPIVGKIAELEMTCKGNGKSILWLGTSIPAGCHYPEYACGILGYKLYNKALASSGICIETGYIGNDRDGKDLSETVAEKEARYRPYVENHTITEEQLNLWKTYSWENMIIPYIDGTIARCDIIMFDHGYNDRANMPNDIQNWDSISKSLVMPDADYNRKTSFVGAFCYLLKKIFTVNPNIRIIIPSYMENQSEEIVRGGKNICKLQEMLCDYFGFTFLPVYKYLGFFTNQYLPNTDTYIYLINQEYGTNYVVQNWAGNNPDGNVTAFQYYCPDGTHPSSDRSGRAQQKYSEAMLKLMCGI